MTTCSVPHVHAWRLHSHLDGCHLFTTYYSCECGASRRIASERNLVTDPYSAMWMQDGRKCKRCAELRRGAEPQSWDDTVEAPA